MTNSEIIKQLLEISNQSNLSEIQQQALKEAARTLEKKGRDGIFEALKWIRMALGLYKDFHD